MPIKIAQITKLIPFSEVQVSLLLCRRKGRPSLLNKPGTSGSLQDTLKGKVCPALEVTSLKAPAHDMTWLLALAAWGARQGPAGSGTKPSF